MVFKTLYHHLSGIRYVRGPLFFTSLALMVWLFLDSIVHLFHHHISMPYGFVVRDIFVEGRDKTAMEMVTKNVPARGVSLFGVSPDHIRQLLEGLPWVRTAIVQRRWPDRLYIRLTERRPLALFQKGDKLGIIDEKGVVLPPLVDMKPYYHLPIMTGDGAAEKVPELLKMIDTYPDVRSHMTGATWVGQRRWTLRMDHKMDILLPDEGLNEALERLNHLATKKDLFLRDIILVDLRLKDKIIIRLSPGARDTMGRGKAPHV